MPRKPAPPEAIYRLADALKAASKALADVPWGHREAFDTWADKIGLGDLSDWASEADQLADKWQGEIEEADDRRRDNPLEPDFRRLGV